MLQAVSRFSERLGWVSEVFRILFYALLIAVFIRTFLFQPYNIPSGSMEDTLQVGDYLFVTKFAYGYSHHSLPWSPKLFSGRIWSGKPERGDVVVFKLPVRPTEDYIKRKQGEPPVREQVLEFFRI
jgi:signal peptidase I